MRAAFGVSRETNVGMTLEELQRTVARLRDEIDAIDRSGETRPEKFVWLMRQLERAHLEVAAYRRRVQNAPTLRGEVPPSRLPRRTAGAPQRPPAP